MSHKTKEESMPDSGYGVYDGGDEKVRAKVLETIFSTLNKITGSGPSSLFTEETELSKDLWAKLRDNLVVTHLYKVRDPLSFPVKVKDMLKNVSLVTN